MPLAVDELPERREPHHDTSRPCIFKTKKKVFHGYYHFKDKNWRTIEPPYFKGIWNRLINGVISWEYNE